jgi:hypothetical protein
MGRMPLLDQSTSILPWGQPEPPEMTLLILNDGGAEVASRMRGAESATRGKESAMKDFIVFVLSIMVVVELRSISGSVSQRRSTR